MLQVYGYSKGCPACDSLKILLDQHNITYEFIEVQRGDHPFKTVPQVFRGQYEYIGNYLDIKTQLEN